MVTARFRSFLALGDVTMKNRNGWLPMGCVAIIALVCLGCGIKTKGGYVAETFTADDGTKITRMNTKEIGIVKQAQRTSGKYRANTICYLDARKCQHSDGTVTYDLLLTIQWSDTGVLETYQDLSSKETLTLAIDGQEVRLLPEGEVSREKDQISHYITDSSIYPVSADVLRELAGAREVNVSVSGEGGRLEGYFESKNLAAFKRFWEENGDTAGQSETPK
jgi:hypothetical protein